ncbi:type VII secretion-associated serine protease [Catellatospora sp. IY07-71]|uniref:S8 family serine peptidase n=1 Tax=Catellatospora sp. IY07-71 TaxID=2728827 RepID=UPI001BB3367D|nr:S8 family serine peptidase [Catellatospora sp. IY07-71]BCJ71525.1 type VII secretion-associated serine protease [Catellatospora sp. IY07-71]
MSAFGPIVRFGTVAVLVAAVVGWPTAAAGRDEIRDGQWFHSFLKTSGAHRITEGAGVTVALVDSGVDADHPDLVGSVIAGADFTDEGPGDGLADRDGHGTAMAGLIAAHGRVTGMAPAAKIMSIRTSVTYASVGGSLVRGIEFATERKVDVISLSRMVVGGSEDTVLRTAVERAIAADIVVVVATGNRSESTRMSYLATIPGVVAVGGVDQKGDHSEISVSGAETTLAAPCDDISSTYVDGRWATATGTSNSTALVAGAAALIRSRYPDLPAREVAHRLTATAVDKGFRGPDGEYGHGVIDIVAALTANVPPMSPSASPSRSSATAASGKPDPETNVPWTRVLVPIVVGVVVVVFVLGIGMRSRRTSR